MLVVRLPIFCQMLTTGGALQQAGAQPCFQACQTFAHRRTGEVQAFGGFGQVAAFHHLQKQFNAIKTRSGHDSIVALDSLISGKLITNKEMHSPENSPTSL